MQAKVASHDTTNRVYLQLSYSGRFCWQGELTGDLQPVSTEGSFLLLDGKETLQASQILLRVDLKFITLCTYQFVTSTSPSGIPRAFDTLPFPGSRAFDKSAAGVGNLTDRTSDQTRAK